MYLRELIRNIFFSHSSWEREIFYYSNYEMWVVVDKWKKKWNFGYNVYIISKIVEIKWKHRLSESSIKKIIEGKFCFSFYFNNMAIFSVRGECIEDTGRLFDIFFNQTFLRPKKTFFFFTIFCDSVSIKSYSRFKFS